MSGKSTSSSSPQLGFDTVRTILSFLDNVRDLAHAMSVNSVWLQAACSVEKLSWWSDAPSTKTDERRLLAFLKFVNSTNGLQALEQISIKSKKGFCNAAIVAILKEAGPNLKQLAISHKSLASRSEPQNNFSPLPLFEVCTPAHF